MKEEVPSQSEATQPPPNRRNSKKRSPNTGSFWSLGHSKCMKASTRSRIWTCKSSTLLPISCWGHSSHHSSLRLNRLSESGLARKISLASSSTPTQISDRVQALFPSVFENPLLSWSTKLDSSSPLQTPWCLLLGEAVPYLGEKVKILRPTTRKAPITMDDIEM